MTKILYIGNYLRSKRNNVSSIHVLGSLFEKEGYEMSYSSAKENKVFRMLDMIRAVMKHYRIVDHVIIDVYSTHNFYFALIISQLCRALSTPYITNLNGGNLPMRLKKYPNLCGVIFDNAELNVAPSKYLKDAFEKYGYINLKHVPNTIDIQNYVLSSRTFERPKLLWVRSFAKIYNPKLAIRVLSRLVELGHNAELCMVGPESDESLEEAQELAEELKVAVTFTGKLTKSEWIALSSNYNIFINTTDFDNTPISVIEAMALGLPIVSTNVGGMPYLIDHKKSGLLVKPRHERLMADAIIRVLECPELRVDLIKNARLKAESFDWKEVRSRWNNILNPSQSQNN